MEVGKGREVKRMEEADLYFTRKTQEKWIGRIVEEEEGRKDEDFPSLFLKA